MHFNNYLNRFQMIADSLLIVWLVAYTLRFASRPVHWLAAMIRFFDAIPWKFVYLLFPTFVTHKHIWCTHAHETRTHPETMGQDGTGNR